MVFAGPIFWDQKHARTIMRAYRDFLPNAPEELGDFRRAEDGPVERPVSEGATGESASVC